MDKFCQGITPTYISTITLTFGDAGENHQGMEMIGTRGEIGSGYTVDELEKMAGYLSEIGLAVELHDLSLDATHQAAVLMIRNYLQLETADRLYQDLVVLNWDTQYLDPRRGKVLKKHARSNLVITEGISAEADYEKGKGTLVDGNTLPLFKTTKLAMVNLLNRANRDDNDCASDNENENEKADNLVCEANQYSDSKKCGIGYHGDTERRKVIAIRLGNSMPMHWQWFHRSKPIGNTFRFVLNHGDLYLMSEKAVGHDWRYSSQVTMRHAAGAEKYLSLEKYKKN
jgi:alkylated DNA repair dioxygenase AlkB